jgi:hypothetical protein
MSTVWDAVACACEARAARECVATSALLLSRLAEAALGRNAKTPDRIAAMHALASLLGAEALGPDGDPGTAVLPEKVLPLSVSRVWCCLI